MPFMKTLCDRRILGSSTTMLSLGDRWLTPFYQIGNPKVGESTNNHKLSHIIMLGMHYVGVTVAYSVTDTSQQSGTNSI